MNSKTYDLCCIGYITRDKIVTPQNTVYMPGGTSFYFAKAIRQLSTEGFLLVTALADEDREAAEDIRRDGIEVNILPTAHSHCFENIYGNNPNERRQRVTATADPFSVEGLKDVQARIIHLGSLLASDFSLDVIRHLAGKSVLSADVQGFLRKVEDILLEGSIVNLPIGRLTPSVTGVWEPSDRRDPDVRALNRPTVSYAPGARLRARLERDVLLQDRVGSTRFYVHSVGSRPGGNSDGRLTPGKLVFVEGSQLLMNGDLPERGVYLLRADTQETVLHVTPADIDICTRGRIVFLLPADIAPGSYRLKVVSQCSTSPRPLKKAREYLWAGELKVE